MKLIYKGEMLHWIMTGVQKPLNTHNLHFRTHSPSLFQPWKPGFQVTLNRVTGVFRFDETHVGNHTLGIGDVRGVARGLVAKSHPQSPLREKIYKTRTTYSIYNIHIAY